LLACHGAAKLLSKPRSDFLPNIELDAIRVFSIISEPQMSILETERLQLRELNTDDAEFIFELVNEPAWLQNIGDKGVRNLADAQQYITNGPQASYARFGFGLYLVVLLNSDVAIGICGLVKRATLADIDIGFALLSRFWGNGYAVEAAAAVLAHARDVIGLPRVVAITAPDNLGSKQVLEKIGLRFDKMIDLPGYDQPSRFFTTDA
jgi:ribosomal-protein-alanine N-acetyltransferase